MWIIDALKEFIEVGHAAVIHFPIVGSLMAFTFAACGVLLKITVDFLRKHNTISEETQETGHRFAERFEFASYVMIFVGIAGFLIAGITGFGSTGGIEPAINNVLLEYKIRLSLYAFVMLFPPLVQKTYIGLKFRQCLFTRKSILVPLLYLFPLAISATLTSILAGVGGKYMTGHSILETFGLGFLIPET